MIAAAAPPRGPLTRANNPTVTNYSCRNSAVLAGLAALFSGDTSQRKPVGEETAAVLARDCSLRCASQMARTEGNCTRTACTDISQPTHVSRTNMELPSASTVGEPGGEPSSADIGRLRAHRSVRYPALTRHPATAADATRQARPRSHRGGQGFKSPQLHPGQGPVVISQPALLAVVQQHGTATSRCRAACQVA
jgi:hypothetical protein